MPRAASFILFAVLLAAAASSAHAGAGHKAVIGRFFSTRTNCTGTVSVDEYHIDECEGDKKMTLTGSVRAAHAQIDCCVCCNWRCRGSGKFQESGRLCENSDLFFPPSFQSRTLIFLPHSAHISNDIFYRHGL
jgi:hypothetical protein